MRTCPDCGTANTARAKFCMECGAALPLPAAAAAGSVGASALLNLDECVRRLRSHIKHLHEPVPPASSPLIGALNVSFNAIPAEAIEARISLIGAMGQTGDPAVLKTLLLACATPARDVRKAIASALGQIPHSLAAYLLLQLLLDGSSRVRQAALESLLDNSHCDFGEVLVASCLKSQTLFGVALRRIPLLNHRQQQRILSGLKTIDVGTDERIISVVSSISRACGAAGSVTQDSREPSLHQLQDRDLPHRPRSTGSSATDGSGRSGPGRGRTHAPPSPKTDPASAWPTSELTSPQDLEPDEIATHSNESLPAASVTNWEIDETGQSDDGDQEPSGSYTRPSTVPFTGPDSNTSLDLNSVTLLDQEDTDQGDEVLARLMTDSSQDIDELPRHGSGLESGFFEAVSGRMLEPDDSAELDAVELEPAGALPSRSRTSPASRIASRTSGTSSREINAQRSPLGVKVPGAAETPSPAAAAYNAIRRRAQTLNPDQRPASVRNATPAASSHSVPAQDLAASSPFIPAFGPTTLSNPDLVTSSTPHATSTSTIAVSIERDLPGTTTQTAGRTVPRATEIQSDEEDEHELAEKRAAQVRLQQEQNLERLRKARDEAFRELLNQQETVPAPTSRAISRKIAALLATPMTDLGRIRVQLLELGKTASPGVLETLAAFSQKSAKDIRLACAEALGMVPHHGSAVLLLKFLADKSGTVVDAAVRSLMTVRQNPVWPVVLAAGLVNSSLKSIVTAGVEGLDDEQKSLVEQLLLSSAVSPDHSLAAFSLSLLARITGATHFDTMLVLADSKSPLVRAAAVEGLVRTGEKRAISRINEALTDADAGVRNQAAIAIGTIHSPRSIELLGQLLRDSDLTVRRSAAQSAARIEEPEIGDALIAAIEQETDPETLEAFLEALQKSRGRNAFPVLSRIIDSESKHLRELALKALRRLRLPESVPLFRRLLDESDTDLRIHAVEQLTVLKDESQLERFRDMLKKDTSEKVRAVCARALGDFQDKSALTLLEEALQDHPAVRFQAVIGLGRLGLATAGPILLGLLRDSQPEIRYQAVRGIGLLKLEDCVEQIEPLCQDDDAMVRRGAAQTLEELGLTRWQIRNRKMRRQALRGLSMLTPSHLVGMVPGRGKGVLAVAALGILFLSVQTLSGLTTFFRGTSSLPVQRVVAVAVSGEKESAFVLRKQNVMDVISTTDGSLRSRVQLPPGTSQIFPESGGGLIAVAISSLHRLSPENDFSAEGAPTVSLEKSPVSTWFNHGDNTICLFLEKGGLTDLQILDGTKLEPVKTISINSKCQGLSVVSPDGKMALLTRNDGTMSLCDLSSGEQFTGDIARMTKQSSLGAIRSVTFTADMKYLCLGTSASLIVLNVKNMAVVRNQASPGGFTALHAIPGGSGLIAVSGQGRAFSFRDDFSAFDEVKLEGYADLLAIDRAGEIIVMGDTEGRDANAFSLKDKKRIFEFLAD